jgi:hypothetical protein
MEVQIQAGVLVDLHLMEGCHRLKVLTMQPEDLA